MEHQLFPPAALRISSGASACTILLQVEKVAKSTVCWGCDGLPLKPWDPPEEKLYPILDDLLDDWQAGYQPPFTGIQLVGHRWSPETHQIKDFLARNHIPYQYLDIELAPQARDLLVERQLESAQLPVVLLPDGETLQAPSTASVAQKIGLKTQATQPFYDLAIVGGGPAGLAAAVYGASEGLRTVIIERDAPGGQAGTSSRIENYLGFPAGLSGGELARRAVTQAKRFGVEILTPQEATGLRVDNHYRIITLSDGSEVACHALIVAVGLSYRKLAVPGIEGLTGAGVYYGASITEALSCRDQPVFVVGAGDEVQWLIEHSSIWDVAQGDYFAKEGDPARYFYVVLAGELQITRTVKGQTMVLGTTPRGIMGGETFLLEGSPTLTSVQAIMPSRLMVFDQPNFLRIFTHCPSVGTKILRTAAERMQGFATIVKQQEKMAALGKLSAGLAHELNNPAAAVKRSADTLQKLLPALQTHGVRLNGVGLSSAALEGLVDYLAQIQTRMATNPPLSPLAQSDREAALEEWLDQYALDNQWEIAATLAAAQVDVAELDGLVETVSPPCVADIMLWLCESLTAASLLGEIAQSTQRISDLVGAIKSYTYMDQGTRQEVDLQHDLDNTLLMLKHKLRNIEVIRQYDPALPRLLARGSELNQVWTNLIDNAIDALGGSGTIWLITRRENNFLMVEVADSGPGIAADVLPHLFEPFFTTKEVGAGTGLGLDISYRIIQQHNGTITVDSRPGHTRFIVRLPQQQPQQ